MRSTLAFQLWMLLLFGGTAPCVCGGDDTSYSTRYIAQLNDGWQMHQSDAVNADEIPTGDWQSVELPHDWSISGPFDNDNPAAGEGGFLPTGIVWYRRSLAIPDDYRHKRVFVEFDGVMANSDVWINEHHLGHRPNGYVSFQYDLTEHLNYGEDESNTLVVRADTSKQIASRWYTGTGIYRPVRLVVTGPVHVDYCGTYVTTPQVAPEQASVRVETTVRNQQDKASEVVIETEIQAANGQPVAESRRPLTLSASAQQKTSSELTVLQPELWDLHEPHLYIVVTRIKSGSQIVDEVRTPFGIRSAEFRADSGFWLNGQNIKIKGVCLHHDGGAFGAAVPSSVWRERLAKLKGLGVNAVRTAHNPMAPDFLDLCDELGLLVMDEYFDCWTNAKRPYDYHLYFEEWAHRDLRDTIRRDRNHPSVILYSVGNEIRDTHNQEKAKRILSGLVQQCHATDPTRPVTQGLFRPNTTGDYHNGLADLLDVIGTNYRDAELLEARRDDPARKIIGTEQSHDRRTWLACRDNPQHAGQFLWVGIDYLGESRRWPITTFNAGLLDRTGRVRPRGYERQSWWSDEPMVRAFRRVAETDATPPDPGYETVEWERRQVLFDDWSPQNQEPHTEALEVYSNCDQVELELNGKSLGFKPRPSDARSRTWKVDYAEGELVAIGQNDGQEVARHTLRTAGKPHVIRLTCKRTLLPEDRNEVAIVEAEIVDEHGTRLPNAVNEVNFQAEGPGHIVAVDSRSIVSHEPFQAAKRRAFQGHCVAYVRRQRGSGSIRVVAKSKGLVDGTYLISDDN